MNAGSHDAANSILWMKAFGAQAVTVPGPRSLEYAPPYVNPHKFDSVLPVVWEENGDKVYSIPNRSSSLAHVIPASAAVSTRPINGLDTAQTSLYVAALDDPSLPEAPLRWRNLHTFSIATAATPAQAISIQITYVPGWHASANDSPHPRHKRRPRPHPAPPVLPRPLPNRNVLRRRPRTFHHPPPQPRHRPSRLPVAPYPLARSNARTLTEPRP